MYFCLFCRNGKKLGKRRTWIKLKRMKAKREKRAWRPCAQPSKWPNSSSISLLFLLLTGSDSFFLHIPSFLLLFFFFLFLSQMGMSLLSSSAQSLCNSPSASSIFSLSRACLNVCSGLCFRGPSQPAPHLNAACSSSDTIYPFPFLLPPCCVPKPKNRGCCAWCPLLYRFVFSMLLFIFNPPYQLDCKHFIFSHH